MSGLNPRSFLAGCAGSALTALAQADDAAKPPQSVDRLIQQLGSKKFREREATSQALDELGRAAWPALRRAAKESTDPEIRLSHKPPSTAGLNAARKHP
jgi:hypothetical protein